MTTNLIPTLNTQRKVTLKKILPYYTERFLITPLIEQDRDLYCRLYCDKQVMKNIGTPLTLEQANKGFDITLRQMRSGAPKIIVWTIIDKTSNQQIGLQAISWYTNKKIKLDKNSVPQPEVGIILCTTAQGKGYATEAMGSLIEYSYQYLAVETVNIYYRRTHSNTISFLRKIGSVMDLSNQPIDSNWQHQYLNKSDWNKKLITSVEV